MWLYSMYMFTTVTCYITQVKHIISEIILIKRLKIFYIKVYDKLIRVTFI